jgi:hypothetical protein
MSDEPRTDRPGGDNGGDNGAAGGTGGTGERLSGPGAGLGATGRTADQFDPGDAPAGGDYNDPGGIDTAAEEETTSDGPG